VAVLRIGLGLWWLESFRHKNKKAWFERQSGIQWAASVAEKHRWPVVRRGFERLVVPRPKAMSYVVVLGELALGLGLALGFLTPIAAVASILLNLSYFVLMIHDWAEQGQNSMMVLAAVVVLGAHGWQKWSLDSALGLF
jgi:thiosulfate dehydrogenase [quinone] large subunit